MLPESGFHIHTLPRRARRILVPGLSRRQKRSCNLLNLLPLFPVLPGSSPGGPTSNPLILLGFVLGTLVPQFSSDLGPRAQNSEQRVVCQAGVATRELRLSAEAIRIDGKSRGCTAGDAAFQSGLTRGRELFDPVYPSPA